MTDTCDDCGAKLKKVQLLSFDGEWVCPDCDLPGDKV